MDFVAVMDQVIALLRQRGRLTYRTLQLQFQLDETHLEVLKDELIYGQRLAVDEGGRVLVWMGDAAAPSSLLPPSAQPASQSAKPWIINPCAATDKGGVAASLPRARHGPPTPPAKGLRGARRAHSDFVFAGLAEEALGSLFAVPFPSLLADDSFPPLSPAGLSAEAAFLYESLR